MTSLNLTFAAAPTVTLTGPDALSLTFPAPQAVTLAAVGIQGPGGGSGGSSVWGGITGNLSDQTDLQAALYAKASTSSLAAIATSGSASDLSAGTLPAARFDDTAHGSRAGGALHADVIASGAAGFMTGADKTKLDAITGTNTGDQTSIVGITGTKAQFDAAVTDGNLLYVGDVTQYTDEAAQDAVGAMVDASLTYVDATPLLQRAALTGAITAPAGSNTTSLGSFTKSQLSAAVSDGDPIYVGDGLAGGNSGEVQYNNAGALAGAADVEIEGGQLRLPYVSTPATPAAGGLKLYGMDFGPGAPAFLLPSGKVRVIQSDLGDFNIRRWSPGIGVATLTLESTLNVSAVGTASIAAPANTNLHNKMPRTDFLVTVAAAAAIAGWRISAGTGQFLSVGRDANSPGGFHTRQLWGPATGVTVATLRGFCGLANGWNSAPTDVEPSTRLNFVGMAWDAADTNIQIMHNDGSGAATKIDLGASFPVPAADRTEVYELQLYSPNNLTQSVSYRVIRYNTTGKTIAAEATGTITTNLPAVTVLLAPVGAVSVGGTSSVVGAALMGMLVATEY